MKTKLFLLSIILTVMAWGQACVGTPDPRTWSGTYAGGTSYDACNVVFYAPNSSAYVSLRRANIGNTPTTSPTWWTLLYSTPVYLQSTTPLQGSQIALDYNFAYALNAQLASVPYTGATADVDLGVHGIFAGQTTSGPILTGNLFKNGANGDFIGIPLQLPTSSGALKRVAVFSVISSGVGTGVGGTACMSSGTDAGLANGLCTDSYGRWLTQGANPSCTGCSASGTDSFGTIQSSGATFTLTFANAWASSPACMMVTSNYAVQPLYSWTMGGITVSNSVGGAEYIYACVGTAPLPAW